MLTKGGVSHLCGLVSLVGGCITVSTIASTTGANSNSSTTTITTVENPTSTNTNTSLPTTTTTASTPTDSTETTEPTTTLLYSSIAYSTASISSESSASTSSSTTTTVSTTTVPTTQQSSQKSSTISAASQPKKITTSFSIKTTSSNRVTVSMHVSKSTMSDGSSTSVSTTSLSWTTNGNISIPTNSTSVPDPFQFTPGLTIGIVLGLIGLVIIAGLILFHLKRRKKSYRMCTLQYCARCFKFKRLRTSSTGSHGPLTPDDATSVDIPATNQDRELFSIGDQDGGNDGRPSFSRHDSDDDYFYDEIFDRSAFQDRKTFQSNKHLTLSGDEDLDDFDGEFEVPDLEFKRPFSRI